MWIDPSPYREIPPNHHDVSVGAILLPTRKPIVANGGSSLDFVIEQEGDEDTFILMLGARQILTPVGAPIDILEGVFLSEGGAGFRTKAHQGCVRLPVVFDA